MPDIFAIDEVLRTFLRFCDKQSLARLARTSKLLSDPALDILWETLESFLHFLKLFPEHLITFNVMDNGTVKPVSTSLILVFEPSLTPFPDGQPPDHTTPLEARNTLCSTDSCLEVRGSLVHR